MNRQKSIKHKLHAISPPWSEEEKRWFHLQQNQICKRFGITTKDFGSLCYCERLLHRWHEAERLGTIQRDEPTGIPWVYEPDEHGTPLYRSQEPLRDYAKEHTEMAIKIAATYNLSVHIQNDTSGCALHLYRREDLAGRSIQECYLIYGVAIQFPRSM